MEHLSSMGRGVILVAFAVVGSFVGPSASSCPVDFSYVGDFFPSACKTSSPSSSPSATSSPSSNSPSPSNDCCFAAFNTFGLAIAIYLRNFKAFDFPDNSTVFSCYKAFESSLHSNGLRGFSVLSCPSFDVSLFITSPFHCAGIETPGDWKIRVGPTAMDDSCRGDLSSSASCQVCASDVQTAFTAVSSLSPNKSACFYFAVLYAAAIVNELGPSNPGTAGCLLALKATPSGSLKSHHVVVYASVGAALVALSGCVITFFVWLWCLQRRRLYHAEFVKRNKKLLNGSLHPNVGAIWYKFEDIKQATKNFAARNLIGEGGYATVYKGVMLDGSEVAVKRIKNCTPEGDVEFANEVEVINSVRHRNLLALRGCCVASNTSFGHLRLLIYDYMPNGSLEHYLFSGKKPVLQWPNRQRIALDTARGLTYLHTSVQPSIIHRDIKAQNILLDEKLNAHVADFGLAKVTAEGMTHMTTRVAGTQGYLAPEYALYGQLTEKSDVYSFGVLLLVLMSGRQALDVREVYPLITDWAWAVVKRKNALEIVDVHIRTKGAPDLMERFVLVGILCAHLLVVFRPTMSQALKMLQGDADLPKIPDRPVPLVHESLLPGDSLYET